MKTPEEIFLEISAIACPLYGYVKEAVEAQDPIRCSVALQSVTYGMVLALLPQSWRFQVMSEEKKDEVITELGKHLQDVGKEWLKEHEFL